LEGELVIASSHPNETVIKTRVPDIKGVYMVQVISEKGVVYSEKVLVN
jgi:hypothetical protein